MPPRIPALLLTLGFTLLLAEEPDAPRQFDLEGGGSVIGQLLKQDANAYWVDIGHDVLRLPADRLTAVREISEDAPKGSSDNDLVSAENRLYRVRAPGRPRPVESWVSDLGAGVVEIRSRAGQGSGFIINPQGHIITNHHVIAGDRELTVTVFAGSNGDLQRIQYRNIRIVAMDPSTDLALLAIDDELQEPLTWLPLGVAGDMNTGEPVFAIGSPLGLDRTVSRGIVSLTDRLIESILYLQTTAQINPGNSGGPLLNLRGEVIGVNTLKFMRTGIEGVGFAVPSETVKLFLAKRSAYAFDPQNPNTGYHYLNPPRKSEWTPDTSPTETTPSETP